MKLRTIIAALVVAALSAGGPLKAQDNMKERQFKQIFPQGEKLPEQFSKYFIGQAYLAPLTHVGALNVPVSNVTFEPGCRNNWHSHTGGQMLICTAGRGYYQARGEAARELLPGDVVEIPADVEHWHGAAPDSWFSHLAVECNPQTNKNTWLEPVDDEQYAAATAPRGLSQQAERNRRAWFPAETSVLERLDTELAAAVDNFVFGEVMNYGELDTKTRIMVSMACVVAQNARTEYSKLLGAAMANGVTPAEIVEVLFHAIPYAGMAKVEDMVGVTAEFLSSHGVELPLSGAATVTAENRYDKGLALQKYIFGEQIGRMAETMPEDYRHIARFLSANCFGDYQTRTTLDARQRELLTFSILISLGGCESQVKGHIAGNVNMGNGRDVLLAVATQLLPYNGYPRTLNAIACIDEVIPAAKQIEP